MNDDDTLVGFFTGDKKGYGKIRTFAPGETIIEEGDAVEHIHMVLNGTVISSVTNGKNEVMRYHRASTINNEEVAAIIGAGNYLNGTPSRRRYRAACDCMVVSIDTVKLNQLYNDGKVLPLIRDMLRNADPEVQKALSKHLRAVYERTGVPGMNPDEPDGLFRVPEGMKDKTAAKLDAAYRKFASKLACSILKKRMKSTEDLSQSIFAEPVHRERERTLPPPPPGSSARHAWLASRKGV